jgi:hypothetical protein
LALATLLTSACSFKATRPCTDAGDPSREKAIRGTKQCQQVKTTTGQFVNHGEYREWHPNGKLALEGEYRAGRKHGRWYEYDDQGKKIGDTWWEEGVEVPKDDASRKTDAKGADKKR